jgi:hypothetical protein
MRNTKLLAACAGIAAFGLGAALAPATASAGTLSFGVDFIIGVGTANIPVALGVTTSDTLTTVTSNGNPFSGYAVIGLTGTVGTEAVTGVGSTSDYWVDDGTNVYADNLFVPYVPAADAVDYNGLAIQTGSSYYLLWWQPADPTVPNYPYPDGDDEGVDSSDPSYIYHDSNAVPEPASLAALGFGFGVIGLLRRKPSAA